MVYEWHRRAFFHADTGSLALWNHEAILGNEVDDTRVYCNPAQNLIATRP